MIPPFQRVGRQPHVMHGFLRPCLTREREQGYEDNTLHTGDWEHSYLGTRRSRLFLTIVGSQLTKERAAPCRGDGSRKVELDPTGPSFNVGTAPPSFNQVEMQERPTAHVEHVGLLLGDQA